MKRRQVRVFEDSEDEQQNGKQSEFDSQSSRSSSSTHGFNLRDRKEILLRKRKPNLSRDVRLRPRSGNMNYNDQNSPSHEEDYKRTSYRTRFIEQSYENNTDSGVKTRSYSKRDSNEGKTEQPEKNQGAKLDKEPENSTDIFDVTLPKKNEFEMNTYCTTSTPNDNHIKEPESSDEVENGRIYQLRKRKPKFSMTNGIGYKYDTAKDESSDEEVVSNRKIYELRKRKSKFVKNNGREYDYNGFENAWGKNTRSSSRKRKRKRRISSTSHSSDEEKNCVVRSTKPSSPVKRNHKPKPTTSNDVDAASHIKLSDIQPIIIDTDIKFEQVGGLESHIHCLKEMVIFPMVYPEVFSTFGMKPPKGVLFHGPPGTGKTLLARTLASECSNSRGQKVSFFLRKGGDCLSKWFGESEKHLRLLFEQATLKRPSIIFFDEIDGLCPVRTNKQDQVHTSIVSTLLSLMDGLEARGDVIIIGATNRIDSIDPALRRPGRFDRELYFPLPATKQREDILKIHFSKWNDAAPSPQLITEISGMTAGFCGADLQALCSEAMLHSLRRTYPQIYQSRNKLVVDPTQVKVERIDFIKAQTLIVPSSLRSDTRSGRRLQQFLKPLLESMIEKILIKIIKIFPYADSKTKCHIQSEHCLFQARFLIVGKSAGQGQTSFVAPALLHDMEHLSVHTLNLSTLMSDSSVSVAEASIRIVKEAVKRSPSILYLPNIDQLWQYSSDADKLILYEEIQNISLSAPVLVLATADSLFEQLDQTLQTLFQNHLRSVHIMTEPLKNSREDFLRPLFMQLPFKSPLEPNLKKSAYEVLTIAPPPPPRKMTPEEIEQLEEQEEHKLVELRVYLREVCRDLCKRREFRMFVKPVDMDEVRDYLDVIKEPMDLEAMMNKIDLNKYTSAKEFLADIELICTNALEYNPNKTDADRRIRHLAVALKDYAYAKIKGEMDTDFEEECRTIAKNREERSKPPDKNAQKEQTASAKCSPNKKNNTYIGTIDPLLKEDSDFVDISELLADKSECSKINIDKTQMEKLYQKCLLITKCSDLQTLAEFYSQILKIVMTYAKTTDRVNLVQDIAQELKKFTTVHKPEIEH